MRALFLSILLMFSSQLLAQDNPVVVMETNKGTITIELWADKAPISVENFLRYTDNELYDGLIFHRVIEGFMIQGGGFNEEMVQLSTYEPSKTKPAQMSLMIAALSRWHAPMLWIVPPANFL